MKKVILIDDEPLAQIILEEYLESYPEISIIAKCSNGFEGVKAITQLKPDLIFLDIQMPKINGFELLELLEYIPDIIFTTAFDAYAIKAFEANALDYLLKPFSKERFDKAIQKWLANTERTKVETFESNLHHAEERNRVVVKNGSNIKIIPIHEIIYLEAYDDYVKIHSTDGLQLKKKTMNHFEEILDPTMFLRVHRSFIVQLQQITKIEQIDKNNHIILLKNGKEIPSSRSGFLKLKEVLGI